MQIVPQFQLVPVGLTPRQLHQLQQFGVGLGVPIIVQPVQMQPPLAPSEQLLHALHNAAVELEKLPLSADANCVRQRLRNLLLSVTQSASIDAVLKECEAFVDKVARVLLLRCRVVQPVDVWTLLRNKGCQFLGQFQAAILQNLIAVLRQHAVMPRKNLIELVVDACERSGARVSKTAVGRVVQLLYRSGCFHIHKDCDGDITSSTLAQQAKNTRMQLRVEFFNYEALRRTHDSLIVQWAHEEGLFLSAERWSQMLYQDRQHKAYLQTIIDQKAVPLSKCIDTLYKYALGMPAVEDCASALRQFAAIPAVASREDGDGFQMSPALATVQDVHAALLRVLSLINAYNSFLSSAAHGVAPQCPTDTGCSTAKGRFVLGVGHTPTRSIASSAEDNDQASPTARPHSNSLNSSPSNAVSPPALLVKSEELDSDFDEHMSATETPAFRPQTRTAQQGAARLPTQPSVPLAVVERWVSGALNETKPMARDGDWDAWKWQGPNGLLDGARRPPTDSFDPLGSEDMLIAPMIDQLIGEDGPKQGAPKRSSDAHRPPAYARTVSSSTADNLLLQDATGDLAMHNGNCPWLFRAASFQDPNSLHF